MKKLLMIAIMCLFVASAYAFEAKLYGSAEFGGAWIINASGNDGKGSEGRRNYNNTYWEHFLRIWAEISPEENTKIVLRATPLDRRLGTKPAPENKKTGVQLDRAWIQYTLWDQLTLAGGRLQANNYATYGWAQGWYNGSFVESGGGDGVLVRYQPDDDLSFWAVIHKVIESSEADLFNSTHNSEDADNYIIGADIAIDNVFYINPRVAYSNTGNGGGVDRTSLWSGYLDFAYLPEEGLNVIVAAAFVSGDNGEGAMHIGNVNNSNNLDADDTYTAYGAYADVSFKSEMFKVGILGAYSSWDKKKGFFTFGGDFDKTIVIDDAINDEYGMPASTMFQLYAEIYAMPDLVIAPSFAYYMSNVSKKEYYVGFGMNDEKLISKDFNAFEFDLAASYQFTEATSLSAGYGIAIMNDLLKGAGSTDTYDADPVHKLFWTVQTKF